MTDEQGGENRAGPWSGNTKTKTEKMAAERREFRLRHVFAAALNSWRKLQGPTTLKRFEYGGGRV
jgi:hypothetical protein